MATEYIRFVEQLFQPTNRKTKIYEVRSITTDVVLGEIKWFGRWRQFCFYPRENTIFNRDCLQKIARECEIKTFKQRQRRELEHGSV